MKIESLIFSVGVAFFFPLGIIYGLVTEWDEPVGVVGILLAGGLALMIGGYFWITSRRIDARPEDDPQADIAEGAGEVGTFAPYSWWPLWAALSAASVFLGLAVGWWMVFLGVPLLGLATVGWVFEYYRGEHVH